MGALGKLAARPISQVRQCDHANGCHYKTTRYDVPLFFLCVRTNVGYQTVAEFVVQTETKEHILEAIEILKQ